MSRCIECDRCKKSCHMLNEYNIYPSMIFEGKNVQQGAYACNLCGLCKKVCPKNLYLGDEFLKFRRKKINVKNKNISKARSFQRVTASKIFVSPRKENRKVLFLPGCSLASHDGEILRNIKRYLDERVGETNIHIDCCGKPAKVIGDAQLYRSISNRYLENISRTESEVVITACGNCYNILKENGMEIELLWDVIARNGVPEVKGKWTSGDMKIKIHDPCSLREEKTSHKAIRNMLEIMKIDFKEFEYNRDHTKCCGAGGMLGMLNWDYASEVGKRRVEEDTIILCYCQSCVEFFVNCGGKAIHILDLLFGDKPRVTDKGKSSYVRWKNRFMNRRV